MVKKKENTAFESSSTSETVRTSQRVFIMVCSWGCLSGWRDDIEWNQIEKVVTVVLTSLSSR